MHPGQYPPRDNNPQPPYNPNYYQPPYGNLPPPVWPGQPQPQPHRYSGWLLAALVIGYLISITLAFIEAFVTNNLDATAETTSTSAGILGYIGAFLLVIIEVIIIVKDGRSFFTLYGRLQWRRMKTWLKIVVALVYFCGWIMSAIYLVMAIRYYLRVRQQRLGDALRDGWLWYRSKSQKVQVILGVCAASLLVFGMIGVSAAAMADRAATLALLTPTAAPTQATLNADTTTVTPNLIVTSIATPSATPTPKPTPKPASKPTPKPKPSCTAVNGNPWCYNFLPGNLIYSPPGSFCSYFACIGNFWNGHGYVVECNDGDYSKSGGIRGACSYHQGVRRPLYSH